MLKRTIKYEDYNGEPASEIVYFNISKAELIELEVSYKVGFQEHLQAIIDSEDRKGLIEEFKTLILMAYGVKSEDGKRFIKSEELRTEFTQTAAYDALFMELATDENAASKFILGVVPKDMTTEMVEQDKPLSPPAPPQQRPSELETK
jgi:hypothetical protein